MSFVEKIKKEYFAFKLAMAAKANIDDVVFVESNTRYTTMSEIEGSGDWVQELIVCKKVGDNVFEISTEEYQFSKDVSTDIVRNNTVDNFRTLFEQFKISENIYYVDKEYKPIESAKKM